MRRALLPLVSLSLLLAACGGTKTVVKTPPAPPPFVVAGGHCLKAPADTAAICQLRTLPAPLSLTSPLGAPQLRGLDSWGPPPLSVLDGGYQFGNAYLSTDPSKNWSRASVAAYRRAGKGVVMTWETYATRAAAGYSAGVYDAIHASQQAAQDGAPGAPINFAVDFQAGCAQITPYFKGVHVILGSRAGVYGGYDQVWCVARQGLVGHENWQTYAWSSGRWLPSSIAPQEQWLNGSTYDQDRALTGHYGQAFQSSPTPTPNGIGILDRTVRHIRIRAYSPVWGAPRLVVASEYKTVKTWRANRCRRPARRKVCTTSVDHAKALEARVIYVAHHKGPGRRQFAHPPRWGVNHLGARHLILHGITGK